MGGWAWFNESTGEHDFGGVRETTNNRMEMTAILSALRKLPDGSSVKIYSDSTYCVTGLNQWRHGWKKKGWVKAGKPILNADLWKELDKETYRVNATFVWVRGHNGTRGNEMADLLANKGRDSCSKR
jgi:ribonuclease HI